MICICSTSTGYFFFTILNYNRSRLRTLVLWFKWKMMMVDREMLDMESVQHHCISACAVLAIIELHTHS